MKGWPKTQPKKEAEQIRKEKILQAKEKFIELKAEHEKEIVKKNNDINNTTQRIKQKENSLNQKLAEVNKNDSKIKQIQSNLQVQKSILEKKENELDKLHKKQVEDLEQISNLSAKQAKEQLLETLKDKAKTDALENANIVQSYISKDRVPLNRFCTTVHRKVLIQ